MSVHRSKSGTRILPTRRRLFASASETSLSQLRRDHGNHGWSKKHDLKQFVNWWRWVLSAVITAASVHQENPIGMFFGAALLLGGIGEWICRPARTDVLTSPTTRSYIKTTSNPWRPKPLGIGFDILVLCALARAIYLAAFDSCVAGAHMQHITPFVFQDRLLWGRGQSTSVAAQCSVSRYATRSARLASSFRPA
jgi:hypothetical protein